MTAHLTEAEKAEMQAFVAKYLLLRAAKEALAHVRELEDAWQLGVLRECDGGGRVRSNRNLDVRIALQAAIASMERAS